MEEEEEEEEPEPEPEPTEEEKQRLEDIKKDGEEFQKDIKSFGKENFIEELKKVTGVLK